jgi:outer membrane protein assembly factor BamB
MWRLDIPAARGQDTGAWSTPALHEEGLIFVAADSGDLLAVDTDTGVVVWTDFVGVNAWSSPLIVDNTLLIVTNCLNEDRTLRAYDLTDPLAPEEMWDATLTTGGCIEATPAVWNGQIFVGSRDGFMYAFSS